MYLMKLKTLNVSNSRTLFTTTIVGDIQSKLIRMYTYKSCVNKKHLVLIDAFAKRMKSHILCTQAFNVN